MCSVGERDVLVFKGVMDSLLVLGIVSLDQYLDVLLGVDELWRRSDIVGYKACLHVIKL